jgi:hypothetical protein
MQFFLLCKPYPQVFDAGLNLQGYRLHLRSDRIISMTY